jgi:DNA-binding transcriptional ArsR family regulator
MSGAPRRIESRVEPVYLGAMTLLHPTTEQITLTNVLAVLGDSTRLAIIAQLARDEATPMRCGQFLDLGSKTNISYHVAKLREAGVVRTETCGTSRLISLRREDLDKLFPGLLDSIIASAADLPLPVALED